MFFQAKKPAPHVELALWMLRKAIQSLPAVLLPKALDALDALLDPDTPAWRRALIADPDDGKLQRAVVSILRRENLATQAFLQEADKALAEGERTLFELIQFVSDNQRLSSGRLADRVHRERVAGRLMALAA